MNEGLMNGHTGGYTYAAINILFDLLRTKLFETRTAGELLSGILKDWLIYFPGEKKTRFFCV